MAYSINKITLLGNVGQDPKITSFANGGKVANFSLATTESWKDKATGEKKSKTEWHNIVVKSEPLVEIVGKYVKKGSKLIVEGKLETRKDSKDGAGADPELDPGKHAQGVLIAGDVARPQQAA